MAALRDLEEEIEAYMHERHERARADLEARVQSTYRQMVEQTSDPLFSALREAYMQSDPSFRARMEVMSRGD